MKKFLSLLLACALCLCALLPAAAEEPAVSRAPVSAEAFKADYDSLFAALYPKSTLSWISKEIDGQLAWGALMNDELPMLLLLTKDGVIDTIVINFEGPVDEQTLSVFMIQSALIGGTLLLDDSASAQDAFAQAYAELETAFLQFMQSDVETVALWGLDAHFGYSPIDSTNYDFLLVLTFGEE